METQTEQSNPAKEMIFIDQQSIDQQKAAINNTLPFLEAVHEAYSAIPGFPPLDTMGLQLAINSLDAFIENCKLYWYDNTFGQSHKSIGITQAKGIKLVDDQLPDLTAFKLAVMEYKNLFSQRANGNKYSGVEAFEIKDSRVIINQAYVDSFTESAKVYLDSEVEFKVRDTINALIFNINILSQLLPKEVFSFEVFGSYPKTMDFNQLKDIFDVSFPRFEGEGVKFNPKIEFYKKIKPYLRNTGQS